MNKEEVKIFELAEKHLTIDESNEMAKVMGRLRKVVRTNLNNFENSKYIIYSVFSMFHFFI